MRLRAKVRRATGKTRHYVLAATDGEAEAVELPVPAWLEIEAVEGAFFLYSTDEAGRFIADTWHPTLNEAKAQARFEFAVEESDWEVAL